MHKTLLAMFLAVSAFNVQALPSGFVPAQNSDADYVQTDIVDASDLDFATYIAWLEANPTMTQEEYQQAFQNLTNGSPEGEFDPAQVAAEQGVDINSVIEQANSETAQLFTPVAGCSVNVKINLTTQSVSVTKNGASVGSWAVSTGKVGHSTPTGCYRNTALIKNAYSRRYKARMPNFVGFIGTLYGMHAGALPARPARGYGLSHGCVRQGYANSVLMYNTVASCRGGTRICISR